MALPLIGHCVFACFLMKEVVYFLRQILLCVCVCVYVYKPYMKSWSVWL